MNLIWQIPLAIVTVDILLSVCLLFFISAFILKIKFRNIFSLETSEKSFEYMNNKILSYKVKIKEINTKERVIKNRIDNLMNEYENY